MSQLESRGGGGVGGGQPVEVRVAEVGRDLSTSVRSVLEALPAEVARPAALVKALGLGKDVTYRMLRGAEAADPLAAVHLMPGPSPLKRMLKAAGKQGVASEVVDRALAAVERFERLIEEEAGDRGSLDVIISGWLPEVREKIELLSKQSVFRGMSQIKGASVDVMFDLAIMAPSAADETFCDGVMVRGLVGLTRGRRGTVVKLANRVLGPPPGERPVSRTLDGRPVEGLADTILEAYSTLPDERRVARRGPEVEHLVLDDEFVGQSAAIDLVYAEVTERCVKRFSPPGRGVVGRSGPFSEVTIPAKTLVFDLVVHREAFPTVEPRLAIYDTAVDGLANVNDANRDVDRLSLVEAVQPLGDGIGGLRIAEVPAYPRIVRDAFESVGWDPGAFKAYRCRVAFPVYGSQVYLSFDCPEWKG